MGTKLPTRTGQTRAASPNADKAQLLEEQPPEPLEDPPIKAHQSNGKPFKPMSRPGAAPSGDAKDKPIPTALTHPTPVSRPVPLLGPTGAASPNPKPLKAEPHRAMPPEANPESMSFKVEPLEPRPEQASAKLPGAMVPGVKLTKSKPLGT